MNPDNSDIHPVEVFAGMQWEASLVKSLLENAEIQAFLKDEIRGTTMPWQVTPGGINAVKVVVSSRDLELAQQVVKDFEANRQQRVMNRLTMLYFARSDNSLNVSTQTSNSNSNIKHFMNYGSDKKRAVQAKFDAQKIAFGPIMFQAALALRNLGILDLIKGSEAGITMEDVAEKLNLSVYGVKVLLEAGLSLEVVRVENNLFHLTKTGWFLLCDELTRVNMDFTNDVNYLGMFSLTESIKTGKPTGLKVFGDWPTVYEGLSQLPAQVQKSWFGFDHFYSDYAFPEILPMVFRNNPRHILDIGGNTGKFALQCARYNDKARITILDLPGQLAKAKENIKECRVFRQGGSLSHQPAGPFKTFSERS